MITYSNKILKNISININLFEIKFASYTAKIIISFERYFDCQILAVPEEMCYLGYVHFISES